MFVIVANKENTCLMARTHFVTSKIICISMCVLYALVHNEKAIFIECSAVYIATEPNVN